jgi:hypothetical protein
VTQIEGVQEYSTMESTGPKEEEMTGEWMKLHNEGIHNFYSLPKITGYNTSERSDG